MASSTAGLPSTLQSLTPYGLAALRIVTAYLFIQHGTAKLFGFPHQAMFDNLHRCRHGACDPGERAGADAERW